VAERRLLLGAASALVVAGLALLLLRGSGGGSGAAATPGPSGFSGATGRVERRTLAERLTATGTIGYAGETTVLARLAGTVTALPAVGEVVRRDERLYAVDGRSVLLLYGTVPAFRTLAVGVGKGKDVEQLERNLAALGYGPGPVDEDFTAATAAAVTAWQEDAGVDPSGEVELGRVAFLHGPQRVTRLEARLGEALAGGGGQSEAKDKGKGKGEAEPEAVWPSVPVLRASSTRRVVSVELEADQQSIAHRGQRVEVVLPSGAEAPGEVTGLAAREASGGEGPGEEATEAGVEATIAVTGGRKVPALDGASVSVRFTQRVSKHVLSVPLTALVAIGGERFAVFARVGGARRRIVVVPGLAADGYVEVKGKGLKAGMQVETGE
jgi:peptidoglycan hydrolase-like protein with peptidoglycan-binding domain